MPKNAETGQRVGVALSYVESPTPGTAFRVTLLDLRLSIKFAELWLHNGWTKVRYQYRRTAIGPFWHTLNLAVFVVVMGFIWSKALHQDPIRHFVYVGTSMIIWSLISSNITGATSSIIAGQSVALSIRFPYIALAFQHVWESLLRFLHHLVFYAVVMAVAGQPLGFGFFLAIPALVLVLANGVWMSLFVGMVCHAKRDLIPIISNIMQIMMFVTPIFWPKDHLGETLSYAVDYNPLYHLVTIMREPLLGATPLPISWLWSIGTLFVGTMVTAWLYGRLRDRLAYWY